MFSPYLKYVQFESCTQGVGCIIHCTKRAALLSLIYQIRGNPPINLILFTLTITFSNVKTHLLFSDSIKFLLQFDINYKVRKGSLFNFFPPEIFQILETEKATKGMWLGFPSPLPDNTDIITSLIRV